MKVRWSGEANRDINRIYEYLSERSMRGVRTVLGRIDKRVASLRDNPLQGPAIAGSDARMLAIPGTSYVVFYRVDPDEVVVLRVMHGAQQRPPGFRG